MCKSNSKAKLGKPRPLFLEKINPQNQYTNQSPPECELGADVSVYKQEAVVTT